MIVGIRSTKNGRNIEELTVYWSNFIVIKRCIHMIGNYLKSSRAKGTKKFTDCPLMLTSMQKLFNNNQIKCYNISIKEVNLFLKL